MRRLLTAVFLATSPAIAAAQTGPMTYGCDTASGRFSMIEIEMPAAALQVSGKIKPVEFRKDSNWLPMANLRLESIDGQQSAAVRLGTDNAKSKQATAFMEGEIDGATRRGEPLKVDLGAETAFSLKVLSPNNVVITIGGQSARLPVVLGNRVKLKVSCSTGDFIFSEVVWANVP